MVRVFEILSIRQTSANIFAYIEGKVRIDRGVLSEVFNRNQIHVQWTSTCTLEKLSSYMYLSSNFHDVMAYENENKVQFSVF